MPDYDFRTLSPVDFEHLIRDVLNKSLGMELRGYTPGRDQGIDLRQISADGRVTVVQCKHYLESSWSTFMRAVRKEASRRGELSADRYLFATSRSLTPAGHDEVVMALRPLGVGHNDVWDRERLNAALSLHRDVERRNIKLWISSAGVLDAILNAGRWQRGEATLDEVRDRAKLWVRTSAYDHVLDTLEREGVCIVHGPPGAGKTFLAEMVLLSAAAEEWNVVHVSGDIEDAWRALLPDETNQIFYYNDFLGESQLGMASKNEPTQLAKFITRIKRFRAHKRFIMTTREQILQQATIEHDALHDLLGDSEQFAVRLDPYPPRIRAEILFNHLYFSDIPQSDRERIAVDNRIVSIIDHPAYNPRMIETALKSALRGSADEKLEAIKHALDRPDRLWGTSFRALPKLGQQILFTMASLPARPWPLRMIREMVVIEDPLNWLPTLARLESTWIITTGQPADKHIAVANPSCRDYLLSVLDDATVAEDQIERIRSLDQIVSLTHAAGLSADTANPVHRSELAHTLMSRRHWLTELIRTRVDIGPGTTVKVFKDAAAMLDVYGTESDTSWLLQRVESLLNDGLAGDVQNALLLAEVLIRLRTGTTAQRDAAAESLVIKAVGAAQTSRDLDAYEALPSGLRMGAAMHAAKRRARDILADEMDHLLRNADDPETIRLDATDIERRAEWYGLEVNIGPLLDRANELPAEEVSAAPWPETGDEDPGDDTTSARWVFAQFDQ